MKMNFKLITLMLALGASSMQLNGSNGYIRLKDLSRLSIDEDLRHSDLYIADNFALEDAIRKFYVTAVGNHLGMLGEITQEHKNSLLLLVDEIEKEQNNIKFKSKLNLGASTISAACGKEAFKSITKHNNNIEKLKQIRKLIEDTKTA